jgi:hypothetical protein
MTSREKILGTMVGSLVALLAIGFFAWKFTDSLSVKNSQIAALRREIGENKVEAAKGLVASGELSEFASISLPPDPAQASHMYRTWLLNELKSVGFKKTNLEVNQSRGEGDAYVVHQFRASGAGDLEMVTDLMYRLEAAEILHRVRGFRVTPIRDQKELDFSVTTEVLSMVDSQERQLPPLSAELLDGPELQGYKDNILGRNLFGPENQAPKLDVPETIEVAINEPLRFQAKASDPDELDQLSFSADLSNLQGASLTETGSVVWTPEKEGEFDFDVVARDNGFPNKESTRRVRVIAYKPQPQIAPPPPEPAQVPGLEKALFAEITAITGSKGQKKIWVSIKSEGRTLRVGVGDSFQVGEVDATVLGINRRDAEVTAANKVYRVELGQRLADAPVVDRLTEDGAE